MVANRLTKAQLNDCKKKLTAFKNTIYALNKNFIIQLSSDYILIKDNDQQLVTIKINEHYLLAQKCKHFSQLAIKTQHQLLSLIYQFIDQTKPYEIYNLIRADEIMFDNEC